MFKWHQVPKAACLKVFGAYGKLYQAYIDLFAWLEKEGYKIAGNPRAVYIDGIWNQEDSDKWLPAHPQFTETGGSDSTKQEIKSRIRNAERRLRKKEWEIVLE